MTMLPLYRRSMSTVLSGFYLLILLAFFWYISTCLVFIPVLQVPTDSFSNVLEPFMLQRLLRRDSLAWVEVRQGANQLPEDWVNVSP